MLAFITLEDNQVAVTHRTLTVESVVQQLDEFRQSYFLSLLKCTNFIFVHTSKNCYKTIVGFRVTSYI